MLDAELDLVGLLADPLAPARRALGTAFLRSSREPEPARGMRNRDHSHFVRTEGGRVVLAEETGPGVITRLWLAIGGVPDPTIGDRARLFLEVDGMEMNLGDTEPGVMIGELTSGTLPGFPQPWVLDRTRASGGFVVSVPIPYASSLRLQLDAMPGLWTYYQIDGRALPAGTRIQPFRAATDAAHDAALAAATALWHRHEHPGVDVVDVAPAPLVPGAVIERELPGPGSITAVVVIADPEARSTLELTIEADGRRVAAAPVAKLTGSAWPAGSYRSAFAASDMDVAALYAPIPFAGRARIQLRNGGLESVSVGLRVRLLSLDGLPDDLGRLEVICGWTTVDVPVSICEQDSSAEYPNAIVGGVATGPGQYAGQTLAFYTPEVWWWGLEADHEVSIDGIPSLLGTGMEDYFGGAFDFMFGPYASPTSGAPGWDRRPDGSADTWMYRWHLFDAIPFDRELRFEFESYVNGARLDGCIFVYRFDRFSSDATP